MRTKDKKNILIVALLVAVVFMSVGYALLSAQLEVSGSSSIKDASWGVKIQDIKVIAKTGTALGGTPQVLSNLSASFDATLSAPGDSVTYQVIVENTGTIDAVLKTYVVDPEDYQEGNFIIYQIEDLNASMELGAGSTMMFNVVAKYNKNATTLPTTPEDLTRDISITLDFEQKK